MKRGPSCEMTADSIRLHLETLEKRTTHSSGRLMLWRLIIRTAQDEYDRELSEMDALKFPVQDPALEVPIA